MTRIAPHTKVGGRLALGDSEVQVWTADLDAELPARYRAALEGLLSAEERDRAARIERRREAVRWARSRALLRAVLGCYLEAKPTDLLFVRGRHGKPRLGGGEGRLRFNMSHSGAIALYAVACEVEVGVDVQTGGRPRSLAVAGRAFGATARARLARMDEHERESEFLRLWTRHEAQAKCRGIGLRGLDDRPAPQRCWTAELDVGERAAAALACSAPPQRVWSQQLDAHGALDSYFSVVSSDVQLCSGDGSGRREPPDDPTTAAS
jgi:4'-phosphopantetheinyl transferase